MTTIIAVLDNKNCFPSTLSYSSNKCIAIKALLYPSLSIEVGNKLGILNKIIVFLLILPDLMYSKQKYDENSTLPITKVYLQIIIQRWTNSFDM